MGQESQRIPGLRRMSRANLTERLHALQQNPQIAIVGDARELEIQQILHELETHQIELEMQNRELRESRTEIETAYDRYVNLYDFAPIGYMTLDRMGVIKEINLTAAAMLGVERRWLIERSLAPRILPTELPLFRNHLKQCHLDEPRVTTILHLVRSDRSTLPIELISVAFEGGTTADSGYLLRTSLTDLTDRRNAEEERDRFFDLSRDLLCVLGRDGYFIRVNPAWVSTLGFSSEELLSRPLLDLIHPDDRALAAQKLEMARQGENITTFQCRVVQKDGGYIWLGWNMVAGANGAYCVARDCTLEVHEKHAAVNQHEWLREVIREIPAPTMLVDTNTGIVLAESVAAGKLMDGYSPGPDETDQRSYYFMDTDRKRLPRNEWPRFRAAQGEQLDGKQLIWCTPARETHIMAWTRLVKAKFGQPDVAIVMLQNINALKESEAALKNAVSELTVQKDLRETFVSALTHDLRTPLASVKINASLILRKHDDLSVLNVLSKNILEGVDRIDTMVRDLLDANRIRAGERLTLKLVDIDLVHLTRSALASMTLLHPNPMVLNANGRIMGRWSKEHLRRMIENLVNNAAKYGAPKQPITVSVSETGLDAVTVSVQNFGELLSPSELAGFFTQYHRSGDAQASGKTGWGIGLTVVRGIVEAHGGSIHATSEPTHGTTFTVRLPRGTFKLESPT